MFRNFIIIAGLLQIREEILFKLKIRFPEFAASIDFEPIYLQDKLEDISDLLRDQFARGIKFEYKFAIVSAHLIVSIILYCSVIKTEDVAYLFGI